MLYGSCVGGDEEKPAGLTSANPSRSRSTGLPFISGGLSKQKNPVATDMGASKDVSLLLHIERKMGKNRYFLNL